MIDLYKTFIIKSFDLNHLMIKSIMKFFMKHKIILLLVFFRTGYVLNCYFLALYTFFDVICSIISILTKQ